MAFGNDGTLYVTRRSQGDVMMLRDRDGDGRADEHLIVASDLKLVHGITIRENRLYLATPITGYVADLQPNGTLENLQPMVENSPDGGQHPNRTIDFGPDGKLYITVVAPVTFATIQMRKALPFCRRNPTVPSGRFMRWA